METIGGKTMGREHVAGVGRPTRLSGAAAQQRLQLTEKTHVVLRYGCGHVMGFPIVLPEAEERREREKALAQRCLLCRVKEAPR